MSYKTYTSEFKAKVVIEVLQGEKSLSEIAAQYNLNPNMVRNWKSEFLENASTIFENPKKAARRKEEALKKEKETMLKNALENYKELQEMFASFDCAIYVENTGTIEQHNMLLDQAEFTDLCRREKFDVLIDIGHANANGWDLEKLICSLAGQIKAYHLHNNDGRRDLHNRILDGTLPFQSIMGTILSKTPNAELIIEYIRPELAQAALFEDIEKVQSMVNAVAD